MKRNQCESDVKETNFSQTTVAVDRDMDKTVGNNQERPHGNDASVMGSKNNGFHGRNAPSRKEGMGTGVVLNPLEFFRSQWNFKWTPQNRSDSQKDHEMTYSNGIDKKTSLDGSLTKDHVDKDGATDVKPLGKMTVARKIAFVFSFLPVILCALLVTVLIPCNNGPQDGLCCENNTSVINDTVVNGTFLA